MLSTENVLKTAATWRGNQNIEGRRTKAQYCDNVARIGSKIIDNRDGEGRMVSVEFSRHFGERSTDRDISNNDAIRAICLGIEIRTDRVRPSKGSGKPVIDERYSYLYDDLCVAVSKKLLDDDITVTHEVISAYRVSPAHQRGFADKLSRLQKELLNAGALRCQIDIRDMTYISYEFSLRGLGASSKTDDEILQESIRWSLKDEAPFKPSPHGQYVLTIALDNKGPARLSLRQLSVLKKWGLGVSDTLHGIKYADGARHIMCYSMTRFSPNSHEWNKTR